MYASERFERVPRAVRLVDELRAADGIIISSPGYHGGVSGLLKNALDYAEDLREDERPYLDGRAVGCLACASGWQAAVGTLAALRSIVHALRGWPTPLGVAINSIDPVFDQEGMVRDPSAATQLEIVAAQVIEFIGGYERTRSGPASWTAT
jgi:FMN reductase